FRGRDEVRHGRTLEETSVAQALIFEELATGAELIRLQAELSFRDVQVLVGKQQLVEEESSLATQWRLLADGADLIRQARARVTDATTPRIDQWPGGSFPAAQLDCAITLGQPTHLCRA